MYSRANPSPRYQELTVLYRRMHTEGERFLDIPAQDTFPGLSLPPQAGRVKRLIERTGAQSILDYGAGKGRQYDLRNFKADDGPAAPQVRRHHRSRHLPPQRRSAREGAITPRGRPGCGDYNRRVRTDRSRTGATHRPCTAAPIRAPATRS